MSKAIKVFFDLGHGGYDTGAVSNGIIERDLNLRVGQLLPALFAKYKNVEIKLSRTDNNTYLSLSQRTFMAKSWGADLLFSIHHNAGGGEGYDIIHSVFTDDSIGDELAVILGEEFQKIGQTKHQVFSKWNSKYNENYYGIIRLASMDSIISEYAFLDSVDHYDIDSEEEVREEAEAILKTLVRFYNLEEIKEEVDTSEVSEYAKASWIKSVEKGIEDGFGPGEVVTSEKLQVYFDKLGLLD